MADLLVVALAELLDRYRASRWILNELHEVVCDARHEMEGVCS